MKMVNLHKSKMSKVSQQNFRNGFTGKLIAGLASLLTLTGASAANIHPRSETNSLRGDFVRIGSDMKTAIIKERKRAATNRKYYK